MQLPRSMSNLGISSPSKDESGTGVRVLCRPNSMSFLFVFFLFSIASLRCVFGVSSSQSFGLEWALRRALFCICAIACMCAVSCFFFAVAAFFESF